MRLIVKWWPLILILIAGGAVCLVDPHIVLWFIVMWPVPSGTSIMYQFWSGFYIVLISLVTSNWLRKQNCHVERCWRTGRYLVADGAFMVCRHHHPDDAVRQGKVSFSHVVHVHREHASRRGMKP